MTDTAYQIPLLADHTSCDSCNAAFPAAWLYNGKGCTDEEGRHFCSQSCKQTFHLPVQYELPYVALIRQ